MLAFVFDLIKSILSRKNKNMDQSYADVDAISRKNTRAILHRLVSVGQKAVADEIGVN